MILRPAKHMMRRVSLGAAAVLVLAALVMLALPAPVRADRYKVYDGDTLEVVRATCLLAHFRLPCPAQRLRLLGVDAFERLQTCRDASGGLLYCGAIATSRLRQLVAMPGFGCQVDEEFVDRHAREFAVCFVGGKDVAAVLVSEGLAFAYGRRTRYVAIEEEAKSEKRGAWGYGGFVRPQFWRSGARD
ncbi:MAG TPA: thermonuclease family protein [Stellaceae bacterium]|nr:thermonuclease family protein [Stellaceae bacterium]